VPALIVTVTSGKPSWGADTSKLLHAVPFILETLLLVVILLELKALFLALAFFALALSLI